MKAQSLQPGDVLVEHGHEFTITQVEPTNTGRLRIRSTLPGGAPHQHLLTPDTDVDTR